MPSLEPSPSGGVSFNAQFAFQPVSRFVMARLTPGDWIGLEADMPIVEVTWIPVVAIAVVLLVAGLLTWVWYRLMARRWLAGPLGAASRLGLVSRVSAGIQTVSMIADGALEGTPVCLRVQLYRSTRRVGAFVPGEGYSPYVEFSYEVFAQLPARARPDALVEVVDNVRERRREFPRDVNSVDFVHESGWIGFRIGGIVQPRADAWLETSLRSVVEIANAMEPVPA